MAFSNIKNFFCAIGFLIIGLLVIIVTASAIEKEYDVKTAMPRKILVIYDAKSAVSISEVSPQRFGAMPLNHMGYVPEYHDVNQPLPDINPGAYAGIILWLSKGDMGSKIKLQEWILQQINKGYRVAFLGTFGFALNNKNLKPFDLTTYTYKERDDHYNITKESPMMGYELKTRAESDGFVPIQLISGSPLLEIKNNKGKLSDMAAITSWGGYVLSPYVLAELPNLQLRWVINPFSFFTQALQLPLMPIPDVTTVNGRRLMMVHVDGDGFSSRAEWNIDEAQYAGEVMEKEIFRHYQVPTTVSVIVGEIAPFGIDKKHSEQFMKVVKNTFELPWVEIASHTYSHPFSWLALEKGKTKKLEHLAVPDYTFNLKTEITGSVDYINKYLAPKNKKTKVYLWSGDTDPSSAAVALTYKDGLANVNGGETTITMDNKSITNIAPLGVPKGGYFQVYAPNQNENIYTNFWRGPFYGYRKVLQTFELTDYPIRYKPIDIYYHYYSASKKASLKALKDVYEWALSQKVYNVYLSEYFQLVLDFNKVEIQSSGEGWVISHNGTLREFRLPVKHGFPDLIHSKNVIGYNEHGGDYYIHLGPEKSSYIVLSKEESTLPYLRSANGRVLSFKRSGRSIVFSLESHMPLEFTLANMKSCTLYFNEEPLKNKTLPSQMDKYRLPEKKAKDLRVKCS